MSILRRARHNRRLRIVGYGNAIVPQLGAAFASAFLLAVLDLSRNSELNSA